MQKEFQKTHLPSETDKAIQQRRLYINLKLASSNQPICEQVDCGEFLWVANGLLASYRQKSRLLVDYLCPADQRIQDFLDRYLADCDLPFPLRLPGNTLVLDRQGIARELSLPPQGNAFESQAIKSYRVSQGILHNTFNDRRTTKGSFHIVEGGLPIPDDKKIVPENTFAHMLHAALNPPAELLRLPFTADQKEQARIFVSLLLRPTVCPEVPPLQPHKRMEIRFFAPGSLVANLDFVESIFGNGGNPFLPQNDAGLDCEHWTGHTGCVILAPHLTELTKKALGLPPLSEASERQVRDGMCWREPDERYNEGQPFKVTARDTSGVIVTLIADNYFGYCKKEVKTQISFSANLYGLAEEEHSGGALVFARFNHGEEFGADSKIHSTDHNFADVMRLYGETMDLQPEGHGIDRRFPELIYVPEDVHFDLNDQRLYWKRDGVERSLKIQPDKTYMYPSGYKVNLQKHPAAPSWRLVGTEAEGTLCHKPCTVSGGGKSEISKSIEDAVLFGPFFVADLGKDLDEVEAIIQRDYSDRLLPELRPDYSRRPSRPLLSPLRSLGSVIKLMTPSRESFTPDYNEWLNSIPHRIKSIVLIIKRFYRSEWGDDWRSHFTVDIINGSPANELKLDNRKLVASYLRVGLEKNGSWRVYKVRQDYIPAEKVPMEDDITASMLVPSTVAKGCPAQRFYPSVKLVHNCEDRFFQRPDDAIKRGFDKQTEWDMSQPDNFLSNYEPLTQAQLQGLIEDVIGFHEYSEPLRNFLLKASAQTECRYTVSPAYPRLVNGKPSTNPRYLQLRPDLAEPFKRYLAETGARLHRRLPLHEPVHFPVDTVIVGRRNNPPEQKTGIRNLAVYNPLHYQELPELFMDFICSLTGKSPSTTGAGSEGALTKGPFNALRFTSDLNNTLLSYILSGYAGFSSPAGYIGPGIRIDHDISLLIPEIFARLAVKLHDPQFLIHEGYLEPLQDFEYRGKLAQASRLGYRITSHFVHSFLGRIFDNPAIVFNEAILKPESQDMAAFADGVDNIVEAQRRVAQAYLDDGSIEEACPPLKALLYIMATGSHEGKTVHHPEIRNLFQRETVLSSDWYRTRLKTQQQRDMALWQKHIAYLEAFLSRPNQPDPAELNALQERLEIAKSRLARVSAPDYPATLVGTIGADPMGANP